jgi:MFS family permease
MASTASPSSRRSLFVLYIAAVCFYWAALYLYVPTLSVYVESKADNLAAVGVVLSMYGLWQAVIRLPLGIAADWLGRRKPFMVVGFGLAGLGAMVMGPANGVLGLTIGRALTGFAAGSWVLLVVAFSSLFPPEDAVRAAAILSAINAVARIVATGVTGSLNALGGYPLAFYAAAVAAALAMIAMLLVREPHRDLNPTTLRQVGALITRRDVLLPALLGVVAQYAIWASTFGFSTNLAKNLGASDVILSAMISMNIGLVFVGNLAMSTFAKRFGSRLMVAVSFVLVALGLGAQASARGIPMVFAGEILMGLASGIGYPVMMGLSIRYVGESQRATAMGLFQSVYAVGMFGGPWLSGIIADVIGIQPMFGVTAIVCFALGLVGTRLLAPRD